MKLNTILKATTLAVLCTMAGTVSAGYQYDWPVYTSASNFQGSLGSARHSSNSTEYIGCYTNGNGYAYCSAADAAGTVKGCATSTAAHLLVLRSFSSSSALSVNFSGGTCTSMTVYNRSQYEPM